MDARDGPADRSSRALLTAALLVLAGATGAAFGRVFAGGAPAARLVLAAAAAVLLAAVLERRHLALSVAASAAAALLMIGVVVFPATTWFGLPTLSTLEALGRALGNLGRRAIEEAAPAPALPALFAPSLIAVWSASYAAHALASRAASPILALVPPAGLVGFANVVAEDGARPAYAAVFLLAALAVIYTSGMRQLDLWGPVLPRRSLSTARLAAGPSGRLARRLGVAVTAVAVFLPGLLPGFGADAVLDLEGGSGARVAISPLVDIRPNLLRRDALELFTVEADRPAYWRLQALDEYTGRFWRPGDPRGERAVPIPGDRSLLPRPPGSGPTLTQRIRVTRLGGRYLPAAQTPVEIATAGLDVRHDLDRGSLIVPEGLTGAFEYNIVSELFSPNPEDLDRDFDFSAVDPRYLALPADTPEAIFDRTFDITGGALTPYRQALAIQNYLRNFTYDLEAPPGHGSDDLLNFLQARRGYCEQFAGTMAVMLRVLGYPSRVAIGFGPGTPDDDGVFHVTTDQAHAWVEMFFPGYGWLPFEPTPTRNNPTAPYLTAPIPSSPGGGQGVDAATGGGRAQTENPQLGHVERRHGGGGPAATLEAEERPTPLWMRVAFGALLALLVIAAIPAWKWASRRRRLRRASTPKDRVLAAFDVLEERAADVGLDRRPEETLLEYEVRLRATIALRDGDLERLTGLVTRAAYGPEGVDAAEALLATDALRVLTGDLRRHAGRGRALMGAIRPAERD